MDTENDQDEIDDVKDGKQTKRGKKVISKGRSMTGKPVDPIDLEPQDKDEKVNEQFEQLLDEAPLTISQRMKRRQLFRRIKPKVLRGREIAKRKMADTARLKKRARKAAVLALKKRYAGEKGARYATLSPSEKMNVDKRIEGKQKLIDKLAKKLLPAIRKAEVVRLSTMRSKKVNEDTEMQKTKQKHQREKESLKQRHDREMDIVRLRKVTAINRQEQVEINTTAELFEVIDNVLDVIESKDTHKTKDGRTAKKGLWYYINQRKKKGLSPKKPGDKGYPKTLNIESVDQDKSSKVYAADTPDQKLPVIMAVDGVPTAKGEIKKPHITEDLNEAFEGMFGGIWAKPAPTIKEIGNPAVDKFLKGTFNHEVDIEEAIRIDEYCEECDLYEDLVVEEAEYQGKKVKLNDPIRTSEVPSKKFKVYVKNGQGNVVVVRFGDPGLSIKRDDPDRRRSFRARHNCDNPGPKWKPRYWSCYQWRSGAKVDN